MPYKGLLLSGFLYKNISIKAITPAAISRYHELQASEKIIDPRLSSLPNSLNTVAVVRRPVKRKYTTSHRLAIMPMVFIETYIILTILA